VRRARNKAKKNGDFDGKKAKTGKKEEMAERGKENFSPKTEPTAKKRWRRGGRSGIMAASGRKIAFRFLKKDRFLNDGRLGKT
jgi:hypothetical protein